MKVDLIRKFKWYIVGFILVAIMLSVSLSFSTWDTLSAKALMKSKSGGFELKWNDYIKDTDGNTIALDKSPQVGDIVTFGNYYQNLTDDGNVADKTAIRWIVVHKENNQLTLLAEKVMAFGSFWGTYYCNSSGNVEWATQANGSYYQNYSKSTVRAWLNSNYTSRNDGGTPFSSAVDTEPQFRGFLAEAFSAEEQKYIVSKQISGIKGYGKDNSPSTPTEAYETVTDKVWLPSYSEVYGTTDSSWGSTIDGSPKKKLSYFKDTVLGDSKTTEILNGYTTAFASSQYSNYTYTGAKHIANAQNSLSGSNVWWWLRSPAPTPTPSPFLPKYSGVLVVHSAGTPGHSNVAASYGGVRPAVCVQL